MHTVKTVSFTPLIPLEPPNPPIFALFPLLLYYDYLIVSYPHLDTVWEVARGNGCQGLAKP